THPGTASALERLRRRTCAGIFDRDQESAPLVLDTLDSGADGDIAAQLLVRDPMLHCVLHQRLEDKRRKANAPQSCRHVDRYAQPMFKPSSLDVQVRLDDVELASERGEFA